MLDRVSWPAAPVHGRSDGRLVTAARWPNGGTLSSLEAEFAAASKAGDFQALKHCLTLDRGSISYPELAAKTGCSEGAARVAVHRLRKRFRELFRASIAATLAEGGAHDVMLKDRTYFRSFE